MWDNSCFVVVICFYIIPLVIFHSRSEWGACTVAADSGWTTHGARCHAGWHRGPHQVMRPLMRNLHLPCFFYSSIKKKEKENYISIFLLLRKQNEQPVSLKHPFACSKDVIIQKVPNISFNLLQKLQYLNLYCLFVLYLFLPT